MEQCTFTQEIAEANNRRFERKVHKFLRAWVCGNADKPLLQFDQPLDEYLANDALRDFFLNSRNPVQKLLKNHYIARHLSRSAKNVYFDEVSGDPFLAPTEQRIYNLARRMESEQMHVPFRSVHPNKQTEAGDVADINTYPTESEEVRYNSGNHFASRPANGNVFNENSKRCSARSAGQLHVLFKRGFLEDRLQDVKSLTATIRENGETQTQFFVICSRHSLKEGHFGVSLVMMDPANPDFPVRVMVCDTILKELPHHPRWWYHFIEEYKNVFGDAVVELLEDLSHPLQKVNIRGDNPYRHDWDCPYYTESMTNALADLVKNKPNFMLNGSLGDIHDEMKAMMPDYYQPNHQIKDRSSIQQANRLKRWNSGRELINELAAEVSQKSKTDGYSAAN